MKTPLRWLKAALLAGSILGAFGCGPDSGYCSRCETGVSQREGEPVRLNRGKCIVNGREIDCTTQAHVECPDCRKQK